MAVIRADVARRDLVVVGASAGGVEAVPRTLAQLPTDLSAAICIVQHLMAASGSSLVDILQRSSALPVAWAEHGDELERGHVYVAPPGVHMMVDESRIVLVGGPRENHSRPAINRLFRSAAAHHGARTIGLLLTGMLDDGAAGCVAIRRAGGYVIVQDPADAAFPSMPVAALDAMTPDRVLPIEAIGAALILALREPIAGAPPPPDDLLLEARLDLPGPHDLETLAALGPQSQIACPECGGPLWEHGSGLTKSFRCYLGHSTSAGSLLATKSTETERALWAAIRSLQERSVTLAKLAADARRLGGGLVAADYESRAREAHDQAARARDFLLELQRELAKSA